MRRGALMTLAQGALPILTRIDPEVAHTVGLKGLRWLRPLWTNSSVAAQRSVRCLGLEFAHPLGLAAGFDKNGDYLDALGALGFSHVELGTVTPRPQPGNPKPRMFRVPGQCALINRMGFNNKGVDHLIARLSCSRYSGLRGISIGKNLSTPIENAHLDYLECLRKVYPFADYIAVNVSSPNTARLRELQSREGLQRILGSLLDERRLLADRYGKTVPVVVKVAPDLDSQQIRVLAGEVRALKLDGVIATNTTADLSVLGQAIAPDQSGGLSGAPLHALSVSVIAQLRAELGAALPIIGVGGIVSAANALASLRAGANLLQVYTGFAYHGPILIEEILQALPA